RHTRSDRDWSSDVCSSDLHNAAPTLAATLTALAAQECEGEFEVIVVDDGSSDRTAAVAADSPLPVRVVREHGVGPGPARNAGVEIGRASCRERGEGAAGAG